MTSLVPPLLHLFGMGLILTGFEVAGPLTAMRAWVAGCLLVATAAKLASKETEGPR